MSLSWPAISRIACRNLQAPSSRKMVNFVHLMRCSSRGCSTSSYHFSKRDNATFNGLPISQGAFARCSPFRPQIRTYATHRIITKFQDLPKSYEDQVGLPFRSQPLSTLEARKIFGQGMLEADANRILRILHGRRVAGTLADPSLPPSVVEARTRAVALAWLRKNVPVNEYEAAGMRAELELQKYEEDILADSERLGLYKPNAGENTPDSKYGVYGRSGLDEIREANEKRLDELEKTKEEALSKQAEEIALNTGTQITLNDRPRPGVELRRPGENERLKYYLKKTEEIAPQEVPNMTVFERLWRSALVVLIVVGGSTLFASVYRPPSRDARIFPEMPPAAATVIGLIVANAAVFVLWRFPPAFPTLQKYFLSVPGYPRALSMLGNTFSHQQISHLATNMVFLWLFGTALCDDIGRGNFMALYLSGGVLATFASLTVCVLGRRFNVSSNGASGSICAIAAAYFWLHRSDPFKILGFLPPEPIPAPPGWFWLLAMVLVDFGSFRRGQKAGFSTDHYAHFAGYASGIAGAYIINKRSMERKILQRNLQGRMDRNHGERSSWKPFT